MVVSHLPLTSASMSHPSARLAERLRQGLATAVLSAAALTVPAAEAAAEREIRLAQSAGAATSPTPRSKTQPAGKKAPTTPAAKGQASSGNHQHSGGCGAHEGGCGPSR
jgi:hypothetical protein